MIGYGCGISKYSKFMTENNKNQDFIVHAVGSFIEKTETKHFRENRWNIWLNQHKKHT